MPATVFTAVAMQANGSDVVQLELDVIQRANMFANGQLLDFSVDILLSQQLRG